MREIELKGLGETIYEHESKCGLKTYIWKNEKLNGSFMTLSVKYGSIHTEFKVDGKTYKVPNGSAHFLEHIKFNVNKNETAHEIFAKSCGETNAFTTFRYTSYLVNVLDNVKENLNNLLDFVYTPYFTKQMVAKEKGIIVEESNADWDNPYAISFFGFLKQFFHEAKYRNEITGLPEEIKKITLEDMKIIYESFYHPENMFLCVTGNVNPYEIAKIVDENLDEKEFGTFKNPIIVAKKEPKSITKNYEEKYLNVISPKIKYGIKIAKNKFKNFSDAELKMYLGIILSNNFGNVSDFKDDLLSKELITEMYPNFDIYDDFCCLIVNIDTEYVDEILKRLKEHFKNLNISEEDFNRKKKANIATLILQYEDPENVNSLIQEDLISVGEIIENKKEIMENISYENMQEIVKIIKDNINNNTVQVIKPEDKKSNQ